MSDGPMYGPYEWPTFSGSVTPRKEETTMARTTGAKTYSGRGRGAQGGKGTIRAPKASGKKGTGFSARKLRKGTIRTTNTYSG